MTDIYGDELCSPNLVITDKHSVPQSIEPAINNPFHDMEFID